MNSPGSLAPFAVVGCFVMLCALPAATATEADFLQVRAIDRPPTLPTGALRVDPAIEAAHSALSSNAMALHLGTGFGFTKHTEGGLSLPPFQIAPESEFGPASLYAAAGFDPLAWLSVVPLAHVGIPVDSGQAWEAGAFVSFQAALTPSLQAWFEPGIVAAIDPAPMQRVNLPVVLSAQVTDRVFAEARAGVSPARVNQTATTVDSTAESTKETSIAVSTMAGYTVGSSDGPLVDFSVGWEWPALVHRADGSASTLPGDWSLLFTGSTNLSLVD